MCYSLYRTGGDHVATPLGHTPWGRAVRADSTRTPGRLSESDYRDVRPRPDATCGALGGQEADRTQGSAWVRGSLVDGMESGSFRGPAAMAVFRERTHRLALSTQGQRP